jgi:hypothetical protein
VLARLPVPLLLAALIACNAGARSNPAREAFAQSSRTIDPGTAVAFRFPASRGPRARLYRLPFLEEVTWRFESSDNPPRSIVGYAIDQNLVYSVTTADELVALDLASGRSHAVDTSVALAALGPSGRVLVVHQSGSVATVDRRSVHRWSTGFLRPPTSVWGASRERAIGIVPDDAGRSLHLVGDGQVTVTQRIPQGSVTVSLWGDAAAVVGDSSLLLLNPADPTARQILELDGPPVLATFSPSGHRLLVAIEDGQLLSVDRFTSNILRTLQLPSAPTDARVDPWGRWLLLRPASVDSIWVVDLVLWTQRPTVAGDWDDGLPVVAPDGTLLVRHDGTISDLTTDSLIPAGSVEGAGDDRWMVFAWDPRRPALEAIETPQVETRRRAAQEIYVQVSSTANPAWADDLAGNLRRAGMAASVLPPDREGDPYRVVLGPYPTREEAEGTGRRLKLPFWIFTRDSLTATP